MGSSELAGHPELWVTSIPESRGPEEDLKMWEEAEAILDKLCAEAEAEGEDYNGGALCALVDAYNRCIEERRRARDLLQLRERWSERRVGGVHEPPPIVIGW